ncbi:LOW QUALITY PROTEIN: zf-CCHC domain-containing protein/bZIP_1 domain-containing protein/UBN2 domain-containing protein, partial [Cephalotus follicularis]
NIINALQSLDKTFSNSELVRKIIMCLPRSWMPKVTTIEETKILSILPLELLGSLMTYELTMQIKFKRFLANKKKFGGKPNRKIYQKGESSKKEEVICFECNKPGHYKSDCPLLKKKESTKKKKSMVATWDDSNESNSDEDTREQVAQLALMAFEEEEEEESEEVTYDELIIMCEKYNSIIASLKKKVRALTNENDELKTIDLTKEINSKDVEIDFLENEVAHLEEENKNLKIEVDALKKTFSKFSSSSEKLENLLGMQRCVFDKAGLGYEEMNN